MLKVREFGDASGRERAMAAALAASTAVASVLGMIQVPSYADLFGLAFALSSFLMICAVEARQ